MFQHSQTPRLVDLPITPNTAIAVLDGHRGSPAQQKHVAQGTRNPVPPMENWDLGSFRLSVRSGPVGSRHRGRARWIPREWLEIEVNLFEISPANLILMIQRSQTPVV